MTSNNTIRALKATQTIEQLGGLQRPTLSSSREVTASDVWQVLDLCSRLKLDVPRELADELASAAQISQRAHKLKTAPTVYTADDLAADDYEQRFIDVMTGQLRVLAKADELINRAKGPAIDRAVATARTHSEALIKLLNRAYPTHSTGELGREFRQAHMILLGWQGSMSQPIGLLADWCLYFAWTQEAWNTLAGRTRLSGHPAPNGVSDYEHAIACGATPYLALSRKDAQIRSEHHEDGFKAATEAQATSRVQAYVQRQFDEQVARAEQEQRRAQDDARAYIREAAEAIGN